jgi:hypothetical protein
MLDFNRVLLAHTMNQLLVISANILQMLRVLLRQCILSLIRFLRRLRQESLNIGFERSQCLGLDLFGARLEKLLARQLFRCDPRFLLARELLLQDVATKLLLLQCVLGFERRETGAEGFTLCVECTLICENLLDEVLITRQQLFILVLLTGELVGQPRDVSHAIQVHGGEFALQLCDQGVLAAQIGFQRNKLGLERVEREIGVGGGGGWRGVGSG